MEYLLFSLKKEGNLSICINMDESGRCYVSEIGSNNRTNTA